MKRNKGYGQVWLILLALVPAVGVTAADGDKPAADGWKFDLVYHRNGRTFSGLIVADTPAGLQFQNIRREPGRPTVVLSTTFIPAEIVRIERLSPEDRTVLKARLAEIASTGRSELQRMEQLELEPIAWNGRPGAGQRYSSDAFVLESDAPAEIVRRTAFRLEQIYDAYARYLPPRAASRKPTSIVLLRSRAEYEARLKQLGLQFVNLAYCDPAANRIVCASDLEQLGRDWEKVRKKHAALRQDLDVQEALLLRLYKSTKEFTRHVQPIRELRKEIDVADRRNEASLYDATRQLFAVLYHEAFHAYLTASVYPPPGPEPPRWLNEGLAQIFETAIVEGGELRLGHADGERLRRVKEAVHKNQLVPIEQLLQAEARQFQAAHAGDRTITGQYYLASWAVAFHLTFERRLLGTAAMDEYVKAAAATNEPFAPFAALVGCSLSDYEKELQRYLKALQSDGSVQSALPVKPGG